MSDIRERDVIRAFVDVSNELVDDYDVVEMLSRLTTNCADLLDVAAVGLLLSDGRGVLHLAASSSERVQHLELLQLQRDEGPCLDCFHLGEPVIVPDLAVEEQRWPQFCPAARALDFASVHALPMLLRDTVMGTLGLFGEKAGRLGDDDLALAQALAHVASVAIVHDNSTADRATINAHLQHALTGRIVLEQAKGVIAYAGRLEMTEALEVLRRYARDHGRRLSDAAAQVVSRELRGEAILEHVRSATVTP